jgi:hypothetical protein
MTIRALICIDVLDDEQPLTSASALAPAKWCEFDSHPPEFLWGGARRGCSLRKVRHPPGCSWLVALARRALRAWK